MITVQTVNIERVSGEATEISFAAKDENGAAVDLTTASSVVWHLKRADGLGSAYITKELDDGISWVSQAGGTFKVTLGAEDTAARVGEFWHCCSVVLSANKATVATGTIVFVLGC